MADKEEKAKKIDVVAQLPVQPVRNYKDEDGNEHEILTLEEALSEILDAVRKIKKSVA